MIFNHDHLLHFIYFALIGLAATCAILGRKTRIGQIFRYGLIWLGFIVVLLFGYQNRYFLQDLRHQVTMGLFPGLFPASPLSRYDDENNLRVILRRSGNGHFETQAQVNNQAQVHFLMDTGASSVVLSYEDALRVGIDGESLKFSITTSTANGLARAAPVRLQSLKIGEIERHNIRAIVAQPQALVDSLLGMNFLNSLSGYNVRADELTLID